MYNNNNNININRKPWQPSPATVIYQPSSSSWHGNGSNSPAVIDVIDMMVMMIIMK